MMQWTRVHYTKPESIEDRRAQRQVASEDEEDELFDQQIAATFHRTISKQKAVAKLHIQQVLIDVDFPEESQSANSYYIEYSFEVHYMHETTVIYDTQ